MKKNLERFAAEMDERIKAGGCSRKLILQKSGIDQSFGYKLLRGTKHTKQRDYLIAIFLAMGMDAKEAEYFLELYGARLLDLSTRRDRILRDALNAHLSFEETNERLMNADVSYLRTGNAK